MVMNWEKKGRRLIINWDITCPPPLQAVSYCVTYLPYSYYMLTFPFSLGESQQSGKKKEGQRQNFKSRIGSIPEIQASHIQSPPSINAVVTSGSGSN